MASTLALTLMLGASFTGLFSLTSEQSHAYRPQCSDGIDNDNNGKVDYPQDENCASPDDDYEGVGQSGNFVTITDGHDSVQPGQAVVYVITLKQQRDTARNVNVTLNLPYQSNVVSASDGGSFQGDTVTWTNVSVYKNVTRTLTVNVNVSPDAKPGQYLVARVKTDGDQATDTSLVEEFVAQSADQFRVSITDGKDFILPNSQLTYTIRVRNIGSQTMTSDVRVAMPYASNFISGSDGAVRDSYNVTWGKISFAPGEEKVFSFTTLVDHDAVNHMLIRSRAYVGTVSALDQTVVSIGQPDNAISTTITDGRNTAEIGQVLTYTVKITNDSDVVGTHVAIDASLPTYGEFVSATEGGITDGNNVRWIITQIAPHDTRTLKYSIRVRSDAPLDSILSAGVVADGVQGTISRDQTKVVLRSTEIGTIEPTIVFRKSADRSEAVPGGKVRYTLFIKNTLDRVISDATILDRFDNRYLSFESAEQSQYLVENIDGRMIWKVPVLKPGETWQTTYILDVSGSAPTGLPLDNVATLRGSDVSDISLTERVSTNTSGVMGDFPTTGAGTDAIMAFILAFGALAATGVQRKLAFGAL